MDESVVLKVLGETENTKTIIRLAVKEDLDRLKEIYAYSRQFMLDNGNTKEWSSVFPEDDEIKDEIDNKKCYVISFWEYKEIELPETDSKKSKKKKDAPTDPTIVIEETIHASFVFDTDVVVRYNNIYQGQWIDSGSYGSLRLLASDGEFSGIYSAVLDFCMPLVSSIRVDTFGENEIMVKLLTRTGFEKCGTVIGAYGIPSVAYQLICPVIEEETEAESTDTTVVENEVAESTESTDETVVVE